MVISYRNLRGSTKFSGVKKLGGSINLEGGGAKIFKNPDPQLYFVGGAGLN